jgi:phosphoserine phosphatase
MNLVLQGAPIGRDDLSRLAALTNANHIVSLSETAYRLTGVREDAPIEPFCSQHALDFAWVPDARRLADVRLLALDMDSTLVAVETIDEMGGLLGIKDRIATVTAQAMRGEIDYAESLRRRVALLAGLDASALGRLLEERLPLSPGAEALIRRCRENRIRTLLVSGGFSVFTERLKAKLGIDESLSNTLEIENGRLTGRVVGDIVDGPGKAKRLVESMRALGASRAQTVAVGDGANDVPMLAEAGVSVAWRAKSVVRERATHALDYAGLDGVLNLFV